jgi:hypothetical protein
MYRGVLLLLVDARKQEHIRRAAGQDYEIQTLSTWSDLCVRAERFAGVVVADVPVTRSESPSPTLSVALEARQFLERFGRPVVVYTAPSHAPALVSLSRTARIRLILEGIDDTPQMLRWEFQSVAAELTRMLLVQGVTSQHRLDERVSYLVSAMLLSETSATSAEQLATMVSASRSSTFRLLRRSPFGSPLRLLRLERVSHAHALLHHHRLSIQETCRILGDQSGRALRRAAALVVGNPSLKQLGDLSPEAFVQRTLARFAISPTRHVPAGLRASVSSKGVNSFRATEE